MFYARRRHSGMGYFGAVVLGIIGGAVAWEFFGERLKRGVKENEHIAAMSRQVSDQASRIRNVTKEQYDRIVEEVGDRYGRLRNISQHELKDMIADLKKNWVKMKDAWNRDRERPGDGNGEISLT